MRRNRSLNLFDKRNLTRSLHFSRDPEAARNETFLVQSVGLAVETRIYPHTSTNGRPTKGEAFGREFI
jgi:hypothetical protein